MLNHISEFLQTRQPDGSIAGYALVVHGLNTRPSVMHALVEELVSAGIHVTLVTLSGHQEPHTDETREQTRARRQAFRTATRERWHADVTSGYHALEHVARQDARRFLVGYSLGGLLGLELIQQGVLRFDRILLLAPALAMHKRNWILRWLPLPRSSLLPSVIPRRLRANDWTPLSAYLELFSSVDSLQAETSYDTLNVPTRVWIDPRDELVSAAGIESWIRRAKLDNWKMSLLNVGNVNSLRGCFHHLVIDPSCTGESAWAELVTSIRSELAVDQVED